jgi:hypothetical protein
MNRNRGIWLPTARSQRLMVPRNYRHQFDELLDRSIHRFGTHVRYLKDTRLDQVAELDTLPFERGKQRSVRVDSEPRDTVDYVCRGTSLFEPFYGVRQQ